MPNELGPIDGPNMGEPRAETPNGGSLGPSHVDTGIATGGGSVVKFGFTASADKLPGDGTGKRPDIQTSIESGETPMPDYSDKISDEKHVVFVSDSSRLATEQNRTEQIVKS